MLSLFSPGCACSKELAQLYTLYAALESALKTLIDQGVTIMQDISGLTASVAKNTTVIGSAITLIQGFSAQLAAAGVDPVKLAALQKSLDDNDAALANAVAQNTGGPPPPPPPPPGS